LSDLPSEENQFPKYPYKITFLSGSNYSTLNTKD